MPFFPVRSVREGYERGERRREADLKDPVLEKEIEAAGILLKLWDDLTGLIVDARKNKGAGAEAEKAFGSARAEFARRYPALLEQLEISRGESDEILEALRPAELGQIAALPDIQWKKLSEARSRAELELQGLLGVLESRRLCVTNLNRADVLVRRAVRSWPVKLLCLTLVIVIIFLVLKAIF